jgi:hypothetical protein
MHEDEWLHLLFLITNYTTHEELRNVVLPAAQPVDGLQLCCVPYTIEGFAFTDAARDVLGDAAAAAALQLSIKAVNEMKRSNVLTKGGDPCPQASRCPPPRLPGSYRTVPSALYLLRRLSAWLRQCKLVTCRGSSACFSRTPRCLPFAARSCPCCVLPLICTRVCSSQALPL